MFSAGICTIVMLILLFSWSSSQRTDSVNRWMACLAPLGREEIPHRLRHLLNVESGLNDGLALPVVIILLAAAGHRHVNIGQLLGELGLGVALGVAIPWAAIILDRRRWFSATSEYEPLYGFAIGLVVLGAAGLTGANEFLAAFAAGVTVATLSPTIRDSFHRFGELVAELLKLAAVMIFGALISVDLLHQVSVGGVVSRPPRCSSPGP